MTLTVAYNETEVRRGQSPQFSCDPDGGQAVRFLQFNWGDIIQAEYEIMGHSTRLGAGNLSRDLPERHPDKPWLWASRVSFVEGRGARGWQLDSVPSGSATYPVKSAIYQYGVLRIDYVWRPYSLLKDYEITGNNEYERFVEIDENGQTDYITPPSLRFGVLKWVGGGVDVNTRSSFATYGKLIPFANTTFIWHQIPYAYFPRQKIMDAYGKVTKVDLTDPNDSQKLYQAGSLLFCGCRRRRYAMSFQGRDAVDLTYFFRHDPALLPPGTPGSVVGGPNSFPCFREFPFVRRLITDTGTDPGIGTRTGHCVYDEFDPTDLFKVI